MAKKRVAVPLQVKTKILEEYRHRCAVCLRSVKLEVHHIDEDPSNNDERNLIPLCPNCHSDRLHNPFDPLDSDVLSFYRTHKYRQILAAQFRPLLKRLRQLEDVNNLSYEELWQRAQDLIDLVKEHEKGEYYASRIGNLLKPDLDKFVPLPSVSYQFGYLTAGSQNAIDRYNEQQREVARERTPKYQAKVQQGLGQAYELVAEMIQYQQWQDLYMAGDRA